jgi:hypothetical protein
MPICPICDDTGMLSSDVAQPRFCYCAAGKQSRRQWEVNNASGAQQQGSVPRPIGFIDIAELDQVNANVDAMRESLFGVPAPSQISFAKHPGVQLLYRVGQAGHEVSRGEAAQLHELAHVLESFLGGITSVGKKKS